MLVRLLRIKASIIQYCGDNPNVTAVTANDWLLMDSMCKLLEPFYEATLEVRPLSKMHTRTGSV